MGDALTCQRANPWPPARAPGSIPWTRSSAGHRSAIPGRPGGPSDTLLIGPPNADPEPFPKSDDGVKDAGGRPGRLFDLRDRGGVARAGCPAPRRSAAKPGSAEGRSPARSERNSARNTSRLPRDGPSRSGRPSSRLLKILDAWPMSSGSHTPSTIKHNGYLWPEPGKLPPFSLGISRRAATGPVMLKGRSTTWPSPSATSNRPFAQGFGSERGVGGRR